MNNLNLEYIIEDIYNEEQKKGFLDYLNPKNWTMFSGLLQGFSALNKYKENFKELIKSKNADYQKLISLFKDMKENDMPKVVSELIKNEAEKNGLKITDPQLAMKNIFSSKNKLGNLLSYFNTVIKKANELGLNKKVAEIESFSIDDNDLTYLSESLFKQIQHLEIINEVKVVTKTKTSQKITTRNQTKKAGQYISNFGNQGFGSANTKRYKGYKRFFIFLILIVIALIKSMGSLSAAGLTAQDKAEAKQYALDLTFADDANEAKILGDDIKASEDTIKNIEQLKADKDQLEKKLAEKEGSLKAKFNIGGAGDEVKKMQADIKALKTAISSFGDSDKLKQELDSKKAQLEKINQKIDSKKGIVTYLMGDEFGKAVSDEQIKEGITKQLNAQSIELLDESNEKLTEVNDAKTGLFSKTLSSLEDKNPELKNASSETKADVVSKYLEDVSKGKQIDKDTKKSLDDIKELQTKADNLKKAGFAISDKKITTKDLEVFSKKSLAEQISNILNPDDPAEYKITYTYDIKTGEVKIDTSSNDYKALEQDSKMIKNDPLFKNFNQTFKQTLSKLGSDVNKLTKSLEKLQELKLDKADLEDKLQKASDKDKPKIQEKIDKIDNESKKISGNQDPYSLSIGLEALQDLADSKNISVEDAIKIYKGFELQDQIETKIIAANNAAEMKSLGITDPNEFKAYNSLFKGLSSIKTGNWSAVDNKTFVESMKYNGIKFSDIKQVMGYDKESSDQVKTAVNSTLWDIKTSSGEYKISNEGAKVFKSFLEQKIAEKTAQKAGGEVKTDTKTSDTNKTDNKNSTAEKVSPEESVKKLTADQKQNVKDNIKFYKDHIKQLSDKSKIHQHKNFEKMASDAFNDIKKVVFGNTGSDSDVEKFINNPPQALFESKKDVKDLFNIFEQNYFRK